LADKTQHEVEVEFTAKDGASSTINKLGQSAQKLSTNIDKISVRVTGLVKRFGGLGAIFGFGASVNSARKYLNHIENISKQTRMTANAAAGVDEAMKKAGVSASSQSATLNGIVRRQRALRDGSKETAKLAKLYGLNLKKGPQDVLVQMSRQWEKGKMAAGDVVKLVGESGRGTMDLLRKGPAEVQRLINEGQKRMSHVNQLSIHHYKEFGGSVDRVKSAWTRIATIIGVKVLPHLTKLMDSVADKIDSWAEGAAKFGTWLGEHLDSAIQQAKVFSKIMLANYAVMKLSGGTGIMGMAGKIGKRAKGKDKFMGGGGEIAAIGWRAKAAVGKGGLKAKGMGGLARILSKFGRVGKVLTKFFFGAVKLGKIAKFLMKLTVVGLVIGVIVSGIKQLLKNTDGIRSRIGKLLGSIWENIKKIGAQFGKMFGPDSALGRFISMLGKGFLWTIEKILEGINWMVEGALTFSKVASELMKGNFVGWSEAKEMLASEGRGAAHDKYLAGPAKVIGRLAKSLDKAGPISMKQHSQWMQAKKGMVERFGEKEFANMRNRPDFKRMEKKFGQAPGAPEERPTVYQDFRGSRFDITQAFAEGFDPDRIAVAFANDLSSLGERRLQSGLAGTFTG
jgi:hypothetical protein